MEKLVTTIDKPFQHKLAHEVCNLPVLPALAFLSRVIRKLQQRTTLKKNLSPWKLCLNVWSSRDLTLFGNITIIKSLALSKIIFISSLLSVPAGFVDQVNKSLSNFIWNHKPPKIKRSTMIGRINDGGLSMPDFDIIDKSLKAGWVKRLLDPQAQSWKMPFSLLDSVGGPLLFKCTEGRCFKSSFRL